MEGGEEVKCYCLEGDSFFFFSVFFPHDVDGLRVRNSRHSASSETLCVWKNLFVNRTVHDPRRS